MAAALPLMALYGATNVSLSFVNKNLARADCVSFSFLLLTQCAFTVLTLLITGHRPTTFKRFAIESSLMRMLVAVPASAMYAVQHHTRMRTFILCSVDVVLVARQIVPLMCFAVERAAGLELRRQTTGTVGCMVATLAGVALYAWGRMGTGFGIRSGQGLAAVLALHLCSTALSNVYTKHAARKMPASEYTLLVNLTSLPIFAVGSLRAASSPGNRHVGFSEALLAAASVVLSVAISVLASHTQRACDAASFAVLSNGLKVATIALDACFGGEDPVPAVSWAGILIAFAGSVAYSRMRAEANGTTRRGAHGKEPAGVPRRTRKTD